MNIEFYLQGKPGEKDGEMVLSLTEEAMDKLTCSPNPKTKATEEVIKKILEKGAIKPEEIRGYTESLRQESEYLTRIISGEKENPALQERLSLCQVTRILYVQGEKCSEEKREIIICYEDLEFKSQKQQIETPNLGRKEGRFYTINKVIIEHADTEKDRYAGMIDWDEKIDNDDPRQDGWLAYRIPKTVCSEKRINIRTKILNDIVYTYRFSIISEIDHMLKKYINKTIQRYKN